MNFIRKYKKVFLWFVVILCMLLMIFTIGYRYNPGFFNNIYSNVIIAPLKVTNKVTQSGKDYFDEKKNIEELQLENNELKKINETLTIENDRLKQLEDENKNLASLLNTSESYPDYNKLTANVIGKDPSNWYETFIIDKGKKDGVYKDMIVIASGGLVGRVVESSNNYAKVLSIIDDTSSVSGVVTRTDSLGFVKGDTTLLKDGYIRMEFFDLDSEVLENDEVVTSHLSDIYPKDISIGYVKSVVSDEPGLEKYAIIKPYVDFNNIEKVIVILDYFTKDLDQLSKE